MIATQLQPARLATDVNPELVVADLLHDFGELAELLAGELERERWLDAFLLAAGMNQVVEDHLHRDPGSLRKVAANLRLASGPGIAAAASVEGARRLAATTRAWRPGERAVRSFQADLTELVLALALQVARPEPSDPDPDFVARWRGLLAHAQQVSPPLRSEVLRLPTCFRSVDLRPEDMEELAARIGARRPDRATPLLVVGVRTSGSYLAPLQAAYLMQRGFERVAVMTVRPGHGFLDHERSEVKRAAASGSIALVVDDPPSSGGAVARTAALLERGGFPAARIVLSLPLLGASDTIPETLSGFETVVLEREAWAIESSLRPGAIQAALEEMADVSRVESVRRLPVPDIEDPWEDSVARRHVRALYEVGWRAFDGRRTTRHVYVKGVGLGYFGRHSLAVAQALPDYLPELFGLRGGLLYRAWQPDGWRAGPGHALEHIAERIAGYVDTRRRALRVERDVSLRMVGRQAVWQRTADLLLEPFGRMRLPLRPFVHRLARLLLHAVGASVVDGSMGLHHWFAAPLRGSLAVKVDNDERAYSNEDIYSYDAAYDLGSAASSLRVQMGAEAAMTARAAYEGIAGQRLDEERWFLYQLLTARLQQQTLRHHVTSTQHDAPADLIGLLDRVESALEDVQRDYMRACFLRDVGPRLDGPLCAIDVDGTLESAPLGFTSIGPPGALALRALARHGYRAVLASGRSLDEIRVRCESFSLSAGVAEYGAVVYDGIRHESVELLSDQDRSNLDRLRSVLRGIEGVHLDLRYLRSIRAFTLDRRGRRRALPPRIAADALASAGLRTAVVTVPGWSQTDFVSASVNKADGLRAAAARLGSDSRPTVVELAVGDAATDIPMFRVARLAYVPANGDVNLHENGVSFMRGAGPEGVAEAVARLIGHAPGGCRECRAPEQGVGARLLLGLMSGYDKRGWDRLRSALTLAQRVRAR
ncbi:MAG TPA: HAD hydrolase family protein [Candidatus Limnocylindrales bacterium]|nr:HAD hydrolase family protein [Candidatus Limnocylindrales bacterium]